MNKEKLRTAFAAAAFFLLICAAALLSNGNFLGQTLGAAFLPGGEGAGNAQAEGMTEAQKRARAGAGLEKVDPLPPEEVGSETLWLARCIYSETKRAQEQELVAWVLRNRVETNYRGNDSYSEAVLDPYQFSAFNPGSRKRAYYSSLDLDSDASGWRSALVIAHQVANAPISQRPFSKDTRHFFSERSMQGQRSPSWAEAHKQTIPERYKIDERRFRFYQDIR